MLSSTWEKLRWLRTSVGASRKITSGDLSLYDGLEDWRTSSFQPDSPPGGKADGAFEPRFSQLLGKAQTGQM